jgi:arabinofuranosyltransferase
VRFPLVLRAISNAGTWRLVAVLLVVAVVVKAAWVCDDAFITLRTVDNLLHGRGLTWNPGERVQVFTHPLWLGLLVVGDALVPAYWAALLAALACATAATWLLLRGLPEHAPAIAAAGLALALSRAHVDYATSGLENPLAALLVVLTLPVAARAVTGGGAKDGAGIGEGADVGPARWSPVALPLLASLLALTRLDLVLLVLPALGWMVARGGWRQWRPLLVAATPLLAWETFAIVYFGFPLPNTAYAKLGTGIATADLARQGWWYLEASLRRDPLTIAVLAAGLALALARGDRARRLGAAGVLLYLAYVVRIGGDFMQGRFLMVPLVATVVLAAPLLPRGRAGWAVTIGLLSGLLVPGNPVTSPLLPTAGPWFHGVADERAYYGANTGLVARLRPGFREHEHVTAGRQARAVSERQGEAFQVFESIGFYGYHAGPRLHLIDVLGLGDPLLARLPVASPADPGGWRIGHFKRELPTGYRETVAGGRNVIADPAVARLYDDLRLVTTGPLFSRARWGAIWRLNVGGR